MADTADLPQVGDPIPVACGGDIFFKKGTPWASYRGRPVAFCSQACRKTFESDPDAFMDGEIPHPED